MTNRRFSVSPAMAVALLARGSGVRSVLVAGSAFAVGESLTGTEQRSYSGRSTHSFDEALERAAPKVPRAVRQKQLLNVQFRIKASNPHIGEYWAILTPVG